jgi:outer membrane lipoprotein
MRYTIFFLAALFLNACSSLPEAVRGDFGTAPLPAVQTSGADWAGKTVRWGGAVVRIDNRATETWVEIVAQPLDSDARPAGPSEGRFFAVFPGFLDPAAYGAGRELTVVGRIEGAVEKSIGDFPYPFPIVRVERHYFWPPPRPEPRYWRDPWYDPWYPYIYPPWY